MPEIDVTFDDRDVPSTFRVVFNVAPAVAEIAVPDPIFDVCHAMQ